ncbi:MAG: 4Fe-4S dicluster domain-containing protein [Candidatus Delongbacteria bacterium]|nr:4Fe-4S dicluster domain-containing protein [Candidatus Delongbacteria bacterium]
MAKLPGDPGKKLKAEDSQVIRIDEDYCKGCSICIDFCPLEVLSESDQINRKGYYVPKISREQRCIGCRFCELLCPEFAITIKNE